MNLDPRLAGQVTRYHTWPVARSQTVAEHSWQVARLLLAIWHNAPPEVVVHCLTHDMGEVGTGDAPYPIKVRNPILKKEMDRLESIAHNSMVLPWGVPPALNLEGFAHAVFKLCDFIEMWEFGLEEEMRGNRLAHLITTRCRDAIDTGISKLEEYQHPDAATVRDAAHMYIARRARTWSDVA